MALFALKAIIFETIILQLEKFAFFNCTAGEVGAIATLHLFANEVGRLCMTTALLVR